MASSLAKSSYFSVSNEKSEYSSKIPDGPAAGPSEIHGPGKIPLKHRLKNLQPQSVKMQWYRRVFNNPVVAGYVTEPEVWLYSSKRPEALKY